MRDVALLTVTGLLFGSMVGLAVVRFIASMLYRVTPYDPVALGVAVTTLTMVAVLAGFIPARRAARIDPVSCLRSE
jgi:ABC-type antimicrobial peptide transport system permease subunit